jgi:hypothetical protein
MNILIYGEDRVNRVTSTKRFVASVWLSTQTVQAIIAIEQKVPLQTLSISLACISQEFA